MRLDAEQLRREERVALDGYMQFALWLEAADARFRKLTQRSNRGVPTWLRRLRGWIFWRRHQAKMPIPDAIRSWYYDAVEIRRKQARPRFAQLSPNIVSRASVVAEWSDGQQLWWLNFDSLDGVGFYLTEIADDAGRVTRFELRSVFRPDAPPRVLNGPTLTERTHGRDYDELYAGTRGSDGKDVLWRLSFLTS